MPPKQKFVTVPSGLWECYPDYSKLMFTYSREDLLRIENDLTKAKIFQEKVNISFLIH
jgi:hypothetical protein